MFNPYIRKGSCMYGDDMTYCNSECKNNECSRHKSNIDWTTPKHSILGASMCDFSEKCEHYTGV